MIRIIKADGIAEMNFLKELRTRSGETDKAVTQTVTEIINDVRENGDSAVDKYSKKFDGFIPEKRILDREDIRKAAEQCEGEYLEMLRRAAANIERFHRRPGTAELADYRGGRGNTRPAHTRPSSCRRICTGGYRRISIVGAYVRYTGKNSRR